MHGIYILPCCNERSEVIGAQRYHGTDVSDTSRPFGGRGFGYAYDSIGNRTSASETIEGETLIKSYTANELNQYTAIANPDAVGLRGSATSTATVTVNGNAVSRDNIVAPWTPWCYALSADNANGGAFTFAEIMAVVNPPGTNTPDIVESTSGSVYAPPQAESLAYDDDGNLLADGRWEYTWNGENRLVCAEEQVCPTNRTLRKVEYAYDHQGRMVWKVVSHEDTNTQSWEEEKSISYLWDDFNIIAETVASDSATNTTYNVWGLDLDGSLQGAGGVGGLLSVVKDSSTYIPAYDANGNIMEYVSDDGTIVAHREYDPFGGTVVYTSQSAITNQQFAMSFTHWFSTKPWCPVTGLSEYQYRKYSPAIGRWLSWDPIGEAGGVGLYVIVRNSPVVFSDMLGLKPDASIQVWGPFPYKSHPDNYCNGSLETEGAVRTVRELHKDGFCVTNEKEIERGNTISGTPGHFGISPSVGPSVGSPMLGLGVGLGWVSPTYPKYQWYAIYSHEKWRLDLVFEKQETCRVYCGSGYWEQTDARFVGYDLSAKERSKPTIEYQFNLGKIHHADEVTITFKPGTTEVASVEGLGELDAHFSPSCLRCLW